MLSSPLDYTRLLITSDSKALSCINFCTVLSMRGTKSNPFSCGDELSSPMIDMLDKPEDLSVGLYINMATSIDCSGNLTGYYYTYLYQDDPVLEGTISMWSVSKLGHQQVHTCVYNNMMNMYYLYRSAIVNIQSVHVRSTFYVFF